MEAHCGTSRVPTDECTLDRVVSGFDPDSPELDALEQAAEQTATDVIDVAEEHGIPEWYVRMTLRAHDWADEAIEEICNDLRGWSSKRDSEIRLDDERIVSAPSQAGGQGGPAAPAGKQVHGSTQMSATTTSPVMGETNSNLPFDFMGVELRNRQAKAMAEVLVKQHEAKELTNEGFWLAAQTILHLENMGPAHYIISRIGLNKENTARFIATLCSMPVEVKDTPTTSTQKGGSFSL